MGISLNQIMVGAIFLFSPHPLPPTPHIHTSPNPCHHLLLITHTLSFIALFYQQHYQSRHIYLSSSLSSPPTTQTLPSFSLQMASNVISALWESVMVPREVCFLLILPFVIISPQLVVIIIIIIFLSNTHTHTPLSSPHPFPSSHHIPNSYSLPPLTFTLTTTLNSQLRSMQF